MSRVMMMRGELLQLGVCFVTTFPLPTKMNVLVVLPVFLELSC